MRVFIITKEPFPNGMAATNRIKCYARAIHVGGLSCEVLVCGCTEIKGEEIRNTEAIGLYEGVPFRYIGGTTVGTRFKPIRLCAQLMNLFLTERYLHHSLKDGDVLFFNMVRNVRIVRRLSRIAHNKKAFCVFDLCEFPYGTGIETKRTKHLRKVTLEKLFIKLDGIVSISDALIKYAKENTPTSCKHIKVPIMVEYDKYSVPDKSDESESPFIFHSGTLTQQKDGILGAIEAFGMAKQRLQVPIKYILTGCIESSLHTKEIFMLLEKYHIEDSVEFVGYLYSNQIKDYLSRASLVISNRTMSKQDYYGFSTKVGEYLASGTPLITTNWGEVSNWLKNGETAYIIEPENTEALANAIVHVFSNPEEAQRIGNAGQLLCRNCFDYSNWGKPLVAFLTDLGFH